MGDLLRAWPYRGALWRRGSGGRVLSARGVDAVSPAPASPKGIKTNEDRIAYLELGWQVSADPLSVEELAIPE